MQIDVSLEKIKHHAPLSEEYLKYRNDWELLPQTYTLTRFPMSLDIEITNRCNLYCSMCAFHSKKARFKFKDYDMPFFLYKKIVDEGAKKGLKAIKLNYSGEPLLHPHVYDMIKYAKKKGIIDVKFNSNGTLLTNGAIKNLIISGLDKLIISEYDDSRVYQSLINFRCIRDIHARKTPLLRVQRLIYPGENREDIKRFLMEKYGEIADELGLQLYFEYNKKQKNNEKTLFECAFPWQRLLILSDGTILSCCGMPHDAKIIGNAFVDSIEEVWHGTYLTFIREKMRKRESHLIKACIECPMRIKVIERR